jgi:hypothetical protein
MTTGNSAKSVVIIVKECVRQGQGARLSAHAFHEEPKPGVVGDLLQEKSPYSTSTMEGSILQYLYPRGEIRQ